MKCDKVIEKIHLKEVKIEEIKNNTIGCFNLIKDFTIDRCIEQSIDCEFNKNGIKIDMESIYRELFKKIDIDISKLHWSEMYWLYRRKCAFLTLSLSAATVHMYFIEENNEEKLQYSVVDDFNKTIDSKLFNSLIINHILNYGFNPVFSSTIHGNKYHTGNFYISKKSLEKRCCLDTAEKVITNDKLLKCNSYTIAALIILIILTYFFVIFN